MKAAFDLEGLLAPLQGTAPCGPDLEYDPAFLALQAAGAGKPEQQFGDTVIPAAPPDWAGVHAHALALAERTRDLRVAVWLVRSGARLHGWATALDGLRLLQGLLERHWAQVHPQLDPSEGDDAATARLNALEPLVHDSEGLADLRAAALTEARGGPRVRDAELATGAAEPLAGESVPHLAALHKALSSQPDADRIAAQLQQGQPAVQAIATAIEQALGPAQGPEFAPLLRLMKPLATLGAQLLPDGTTSHADAGAIPAATGSVARLQAASPSAPASRDDIRRTLQHACDWIEKNEPASPAPLLIRRAERLIGKSFLDIMRDLVPDGVREVEKLAGPTGDPS